MKKRGFTLIEVLIVIIIIGVLAGALVPRVGSARDSANDSVRVTYAHGVSSAITQYHLDHQDYPEIDDSVKIGNCNCSTLYDGLGNLLLDYGYSREALPRDPVLESSFEFCGEKVTGGQFVYCKMNDSILFVSHVDRNGGNANSSDFQSSVAVTQNMSFGDIASKIGVDGGDLYIYHGG